MPNDRYPSTETCSEHSFEQLGIRMPAHLNARLEEIARREHNGVSAVCRRLLPAALAAHESDAA
jgi:hypothetical protein